MQFMRAARLCFLRGAALLGLCLVTPSSCVSPKGPELPSAPLVFFLLDIQGLWGGQDVYVHSDGSCLIREIVEGGSSTKGLQEHRYLATLPPGYVTQLIATAQSSHFAAYRQGRKSGVPEEAYPFISWQKTSHSKIEAHKWAHEKDPRFDALYKALLQCIKDAQPYRDLYRGPYDRDWMHPDRARKK